MWRDTHPPQQGIEIAQEMVKGAYAQGKSRGKMKGDMRGVSQGVISLVL